MVRGGSSARVMTAAAGSAAALDNGEEGMPLSRRRHQPQLSGIPSFLTEDTQTGDHRRHGHGESSPLPSPPSPCSVPPLPPSRRRRLAPDTVDVVHAPVVNPLFMDTVRAARAARARAARARRRSVRSSRVSARGRRRGFSRAGLSSASPSAFNEASISSFPQIAAAGDCQPVSLSVEQIARRQEISLGKQPVDVYSSGCGDLPERADGSLLVGRSDVVLPSSLPPRFFADVSYVDSSDDDYDGWPYIPTEALDSTFPLNDRMRPSIPSSSTLPAASSWVPSSSAGCSNTMSLNEGEMFENLGSLDDSSEDASSDAASEHIIHIISKYFYYLMLQAKKFKLQILITQVNEPQNWWFNSCKRCFSGMKMQDGRRKCRRCTSTECTQRYKLSVDAIDTELPSEDKPVTGRFMLYGDDAATVIGKDIALLLAQAKGKQNFVPPAITSTVGKKCIVTAVVRDETYDAEEGLIMFEVKKAEMVDQSSAIQVSVSQDTLSTEDQVADTTNPPTVHHDPTSTPMKSILDETGTDEESSFDTDGKKRKAKTSTSNKPEKKSNNTDKRNRSIRQITFDSEE